jgi:DNA invertase Pin-like site-specific DNA recombinase
MKAAIYARVSTTGQDASNQLLELRAHAQRLDYSEVIEYVDYESGTKAERLNFQRMLLDAHQRRFDVLLFWSLDRLTREGPLECLKYLHQLAGYGVSFISHTEPHLASLGIWRDAVIGILATVANFEAVRRRERVNAGIARARTSGTKSGKAIGRPALELKKVEHIRRLRSDGMSYRAVAKEMNIPVATVHQYCTEKITNKRELTYKETENNI